MASTFFSFSFSVIKTMGNWWSERDDHGGNSPAPGSAALPGLEGQGHRKRPRPQDEAGDEEVEELSPRRWVETTGY